MLYHYTTPAGLLGIAESKGLWASNIRYLNDATEYLHAVHIAQRLCSHDLDVSDSERKLFEYLLPWSARKEWGLVENEVGCSYYVTSLTRQPDKLSQWRAYAGRAGYCLGWHSDVIQELADRNGFELQECIYDENEQAKLIGSVIEQALTSWRADPPKVDLCEMWLEPESDEEISESKKFQKFERTFESSFARVATVCKNSAFAEEQEWRLIATSDLAVEESRPIRFREGRNVLIPYAEFSLRDLIKWDAGLSGTTVYVGPNPEPLLASRSIYEIFDSHGWPGVVVNVSEVPHRDW